MKVINKLDINDDTLKPLHSLLAIYEESGKAIDLRTVENEVRRLIHFAYKLGQKHP